MSGLEVLVEATPHHLLMVCSRCGQDALCDTADDARSWATRHLGPTLLAVQYRTAGGSNFAWALREVDRPVMVRAWTLG